MPPPACSPAALVLAACLLAAAAAIPMMSERVHCHVCGGEDHRALFAGQPPPPPCQPEPDLGLPRECPPDYKGCLTKYDGTTLTRTCTERAYEPCGVANGVVYCYCSGRLCNAQTETEMRRLRCAAPKRHRAPEDDEDAAIEDDAGSGDGDLLDTPDDCDVTTRQPPDATTARSGPASTATASSTTYTPGPGDDLEWGSSSQDSIEMTLEANATATAKTNGSGRGDAHRSHSSVVCVLAALFVALSVWRVDAAH